MAQDRTFDVLYPGVTKTPRRDLVLNDRTIVQISTTLRLRAGEFLTHIANGRWGRLAAATTPVDQLSLPVWLQFGEPELQIGAGLAAIVPEACKVSAFLLARHSIIQTDIYTRNPTPGGGGTWAVGDQVCAGLIDAPGMGELPEPHEGRMGLHRWSKAQWLASGAVPEAGLRIGEVVEITAQNYLIVEMF